jgi:two-component system, NarL family, sensor kinase
MVKKYILVFFLLNAFLSKAQSTYADSILVSNLADSIKLEKLHIWIKNNAPNLRETVLKTANIALQLAEKTNNPRFISYAYSDLGNTYYFQEKIEECGTAFTQAKIFAIKSGDLTCLVLALRGLIQYNSDHGDQVKTMLLMKEMEPYLSQIKDLGLRSACYTKFCYIYTSMNRWTEVEFFSRKTIDFSLKNNLANQLPSGYYHLGKFFENKNQLDSALFYIKKAKIGYIVTNNQEEVAGMTMQIAQIYSRQKQPKAAFQEMESALQIVEKNRDTAGIAFVNMEYGKLLLENNRIQEAKSALLKSENIFEKLNLNTYKIDIYNSLSDFYEKTGQPVFSLNYFKKYISVRDTIEGIESRKQLAELEAKFENTKKEQKISLLDQENKNQRLLIGFWAAVAALLTLGAFAGFLYNRNRQRNLLIQEQQRWAETVVNSTEEERRRIAADLHDGIAQQIAALKMYAGGLQRHLKGEQLEQAENLALALENTGKEVRQLAHQMMPRSLADLGLKAALEDLVWMTFSQTEIKATTDLENYTLTPNLTTDTAFYRTAQEAINNIVKHSKAKKVHLSLKNTEIEMILSIEDDGIGLVTEKVKNENKSLGMSNMQSRIRLCNGTLKVVSNSEKGVQIEAKIPI